MSGLASIRYLMCLQAQPPSSGREELEVIVLRAKDLQRSEKIILAILRTETVLKSL
jgi:hypothetical protein